MHYLENRETPEISGDFQINTILMGRCRWACAILGFFAIYSVKGAKFLRFIEKTDKILDLNHEFAQKGASKMEYSYNFWP